MFYVTGRTLAFTWFFLSTRLWYWIFPRSQDVRCQGDKLVQLNSTYNNDNDSNNSNNNDSDSDSDNDNNNNNNNFK